MTPEERLLEKVRAHCLGLQGATEDLPFDEHTLTFKVGGKIFCVVDASEFQGCGLKCDPERVSELRASYDGIRSGKYLHPKHWNLVVPSPLADVPWDVVQSLIDHSHEMVWKGLTKKARLAIQASSHGSRLPS